MEYARKRARTTYVYVTDTVSTMIPADCVDAVVRFRVCDEIREVSDVRYRLSRS